MTPDRLLDSRLILRAAETNLWKPSAADGNSTGGATPNVLDDMASWMGKPWETMGKPQEDGGIMGFNVIFPLVMTNIT